MKKQLKRHPFTVLRDNFADMMRASINFVFHFRRKRTYIPISPEELHSQLHKGIPFTVIDCRDNESYEEEGHIAGAINLPFPNFATLYKSSQFREPVVIACYYGYFNRVAAQTAIEQGTNRVYYLIGGMDAWYRAKLPTVE